MMMTKKLVKSPIKYTIIIRKNDVPHWNLTELINRLGLSHLSRTQQTMHTFYRVTDAHAVL